MQAYNEFTEMDPSFWAFIKFISEGLGYTDRRNGHVKTYTGNDIAHLCASNCVHTSDQLIEDALRYTDMRAAVLNNRVERMLMDAETAEAKFENLYPLYRDNHFLCKLPLNKQKGDMRKTAFFTAMINIIAEDVIRNATGQYTTLGFDDDPGSFAYFFDENQNIVGASSRRLDGAYPSLRNPKIIWEIKEYYYASTFGSRVADGVYETQLDGYEFNDIYNRTGIKPYHVLFVDAYQTWWIKGKSYLCRLIDALHSGVVDEVIFGTEIFSRWPALLESFI